MSQPTSDDLLSPPSPGGHSLAIHDAHTLVLTEAVPLDRHPAAVYLGRLAPGSRRTMRQALDRVAGLLTGDRCTAETLEWSRLRYPHTMAVRAALAERYAPATANKMLAAVRGVLTEAWKLGYMGSDEYQRATHLKGIRGTTIPPGRALSMGELRAMFNVCAADRKPHGARDAALLAVLYGVGLRRSEVVALALSDYLPEERELHVQRGKGRKARKCHAPAGCVAALERWLEVRGTDSGPIFVPIMKGNRFQWRPMTDQAVLYILQQRAHQAGVRAFSPHDLRRTFISDLLEAGGDIATVQRLAGHASVHTTTRYDRRGEVVLKRTAELIHVPYTGDE